VNDVEIQQQPQVNPTKLQIRQQLGVVHRKDCFYSFHFDQYASFNPQIDSVCGIDFDSVIDDRQGHLRFNDHVDLIELVDKASVVRAFKKSGTEDSVYAHRATDDRLGNFIYFHVLRLSSESSVVNVGGAEFAGMGS